MPVGQQVASSRPVRARAALAGELVIAALMMAMVLVMLSLGDAAAYTGLVAGLLVDFFIFFERRSPGWASTPPARWSWPWSPVGFTSLWIYLAVSVVAMQLTALAVRRRGGAESRTAPNSTTRAPAPASGCDAN